MTSGGTIPSTRSMKKNGAPRTAPVASSQRGVGTGTSDSSPTRRIASNWWSSRYAANQADPLELVVEPVRREHRHVVGGRGDPDHVAAASPLPLLSPGHVDED